MRLLEHFAVVLRGSLSVAVIFGLGLILVKVKVLSKDAVSALSKLTFNFFIPLSLFLRMGGLMTLDLLERMWLLPVIYVSIVIVNLILSRYVLLPLTDAPQWFRPWFLLTCAFPNMMMLPLVFATTICREVDFSDGEGGILEAEECSKHGELFLFFGVQLVSLLFWLIGPEMVSQTDDDDDEKEMYKTVPTSEEIVVEEEEEEVDFPEEKSDDGRQSVATSTSDPTSRQKCFALFKRVFGRPPTIAQVIAFPMALIPSVHRAVFDQDSLLSPMIEGMEIMAVGLVPALNLIVAGTLGLTCAEVDFSKVFELVSKRTLLLLVVGRMVILPSLAFVALWFIQPILFEKKSKDELMLLIMYFSACTPSSNTSVVLLERSNHEEAAHALSIVILGQYFFGMISMTVFLTIAFGLMGI